MFERQKKRSQSVKSRKKEKTLFDTKDGSRETQNKTRKKTEHSSSKDSWKLCFIRYDYVMCAVYLNVAI